MLCGRAGGQERCAFDAIVDNEDLHLVSSFDWICSRVKTPRVKKAGGSDGKGTRVPRFLLRTGYAETLHRYTVQIVRTEVYASRSCSKARTGSCQLWNSCVGVSSWICQWYRVCERSDEGPCFLARSKRTTLSVKRIGFRVVDGQLSLLRVPNQPPSMAWVMAFVCRGLLTLYALVAPGRAHARTRLTACEDPPSSLVGKRNHGSNPELDSLINET